MTAAELIGLFEPKVLALPARALRSTPRLRSVTAKRLRVAQTSCFPLTACCACRPRAGPTIPQPASSSTARTSTFCRRPRWTSSARVQQAAGGLAASCAASLGAVGSGARVACAPIRPGRRLHYSTTQCHGLFQCVIQTNTLETISRLCRGRFHGEKKQNRFRCRHETDTKQTQSFQARVVGKFVESWVESWVETRVDSRFTFETAMK